MKDIFAPTLRATAAAVFLIITMATAASAAVTSCVPEGAPGDAPPPAKKTPIQLVLQPTRTMPIRGILTCRDVYGLRLGSSTMTSAVHSTGLDIGIPFSSSNTTTGIQLSLFGSSSGVVTGLQFGSIYSFETGIRGVQLAGLLNLSIGDHDSSYGIQAGLVNITVGGLSGMQAGVVNFSKETDIQLGAVSIAGDGIAQISLLTNIVTAPTKWSKGEVFVQLGGIITNYAPTVRIFQGISIANIANELTGVQLGVFNKADSIRGLQIGLINSAKNLKGVQIGALNINYSSAIKALPLVNIGF